MYKVVIITDPESATGFRLAGSDVLEAEDSVTASRLLSSLLHEDETGIIAVREDFLANLDKSLYEEIERCYHPVIIPIPAPRKGDEVSGYVERLLRRAIGYNVVMRS
ncbi:V-type ATP synthase subunit F [Methanospirillum purgamenti]|jgi:V/A-type H+-transporting ATPase subunit F|uniref:V-type ATP synthase subunit F n=1 Tax=Methanospirillum hungatei TaxID=2203 RepID=A0A8F5VN71_METHU|nr:V-type ATP synthase subunit F [Methanospirillum hungatei]NLW76420.1 V-type ATP synthase subunit F [Methanomicrobiales archaeon]QXO94380.1 V-type ATP synthase subunit F [Methanospirillum hungatei]